MWRNWILILCGVLAVCSAVGQARAQATVDMRRIYDEARKSYYDKDYTGAEERLLKLLKVIPDNGYLNYDLGNVYFKRGEIGKALQYYEKAHLAIPRDADLKTNLALARQKRVDKADESFSDYLADSLYFWAGWLNLFEYQILFALSAAVFWGFFFIQFFRRRPLRGLGLVVVILMQAYLGFGFYLKSEREVAGHYGIVLNAEVEVRSSYLEKEKVLFTIHEGAKVRVIDTQFFGDAEKWLRIRLPQGQTGWVKIAAIGMI